MSKAKPPFKRVLLKISGEALTEKGQTGYDGEGLKRLSSQIVKAVRTGTQIAIVIGSGNILRGRDMVALDVERTSADQMGMLAGVMNAIALQNVIEQSGVPCRVQSAITMPQIAEPYIRRRAIRHLEKGRVVIFAAGTGNPYFTHDTAGSLRALEINAEVLLKGTKVDGVYDGDPERGGEVTRYDTITYDEVLQKELRVMDSTAISLCRENNLPIIVFNIIAGDLEAVVKGESVGTKVTR